MEDKPKSITGSSGLKDFLLLLCSVGFVICGLLIVVFDPDKWFGWLTIAFFGSCTIVSVWQMIAKRRDIISLSGLEDKPEIVIKSSGLKYIFLLLSSTGFAIAGWFFAAFSPEKWLGWMLIVFFGSGAIALAWQAIAKRSRLVINDLGINDKTLGLGTIPWEDIEGAYTVSTSQYEFICLRLHNADYYFARLSRIKRSMASVSEKMGFTPFTLDLSATNVSAATVLDILIKKCNSMNNSR